MRRERSRKVDEWIGQREGMEGIDQFKLMPNKKA